MQDDPIYDTVSRDGAVAASYLFLFLDLLEHMSGK